MKKDVEKITNKQSAEEISKKEPNQRTMRQIYDRILGAFGMKISDDKGNVFYIGRPIDGKVVSEIEGDKLADKIMADRRALKEALNKQREM